MNNIYVVHKTITIPGEFDEFDIRIFKTEKVADKYREELLNKLKEIYNDFEEYIENGYIDVYVTEEKIEDFFEKVEV